MRGDPGLQRFGWPDAARPRAPPRSVAGPHGPASSAAGAWPGASASGPAHAPSGPAAPVHVAGGQAAFGVQQGKGAQLFGVGLLAQQRTRFGDAALSAWAWSRSRLLASALAYSAARRSVRWSGPAAAAAGSSCSRRRPPRWCPSAPARARPSAGAGSAATAWPPRCLARLVRAAALRSAVPATRGGCAGRGRRRCRSGGWRCRASRTWPTCPPGRSLPGPARQSPRGRPRAPCRARSSAGPAPWPPGRPRPRPAPCRGCCCGWPPAPPGSCRPCPAATVRCWLATLRAMWRCVTCDSSCASTDASFVARGGHRDQPQVHADKPPGSAKALTLLSRTRKASQANCTPVSTSTSPRARAAPPAAATATAGIPAAPGRPGRPGRAGSRP
jgi:hypothetical protein